MTDSIMEQRIVALEILATRTQTALEFHLMACERRGIILERLAWLIVTMVAAALAGLFKIVMHL